MAVITIDQFPDYFYELHGHGPYPWQRRLSERAVAGHWPGAIDLPTSTGKTACLDIAVFALAAQASLPTKERNAPRRVFFCVNRRVIVDDAYQRGRRIAREIWQAERDDDSDKPVLRDVATALRSVAGTNADHHIPPLDVLELRGGTYRDNRWSRSIAQPTIVCTTLDQLGSRLLFRGYGVSPNAAPIQAALIAYDSLILLDEAHISEPFRQTLDLVTRYLDPGSWTEQPIGVQPVTVVPMTATPNDTMRQRGVIQLEDDDRAVESLNNRLMASKPGELREVHNVANDAIKVAVEQVGDRPKAVGIIVNRVATARAIYDGLRKHQAESNEKRCPIAADSTIELVIGSMRPIDRDKQAERLSPLVGPDRPKPHSAQTSFVIATQCLEVGADYDFDVLITECASLDALRQRFGRLNRAGRAVEARAIILAAKKDIKVDDKLLDDKPLDPIYGNALARTWNWLNEHARDHCVNFGIDAFTDSLIRHTDNGRPPKELLAPAASLNAPIIMPSYLDLWCQTSPRPVPDPDVSLFIHGPRGGEPDVQVCWRADLVEDTHVNRDQWCDIVALLPPTAAECMRVPISRVRRWLSDQTSAADDSGDVLGVSESDQYLGNRQKGEPVSRIHPAVLWRGVRASRLITSPRDLRPGDTLVLPANIDGSGFLGHLPELHDPCHNSALVESDTYTTKFVNDLAETAFRRARDRAALRLHPTLRYRLPDTPAIHDLFEVAEAHCNERISSSEWTERLTAAAHDFKDASYEANWVRGVIEHLAAHGRHIEAYPDDRGVVLVSRRPLSSSADWFIPATDDGEDETSRLERDTAIILRDHTQHVVDALRNNTERLAIALDPDLFQRAAKLHDLGKADERFQAMLRRTDRTDAWLSAGLTTVFLAKSDGMPQTRTQRRQARERAGLPDGFRHEMLGLQLAEHASDAPADGASRDLLFHLIAAHHGYARPFAPVVPDDELPSVEFDGIALTHEQRRLLIPSHRLDSGIAERFWRLTRRFGWWGLAYLEAVLRLADQQASSNEEAGRYENHGADEPVQAITTMLTGTVDLSRSALPNQMPGLRLPGLDGSNPLGFLAALGLFRIVTGAAGGHSVHMKWEPSAGNWAPHLTHPVLSQDQLLDLLCRELVENIKNHPADLFSTLNGEDACRRRADIESHICSACVSERIVTDWIGAIASDIVPAAAINQLQTVRRDYFYGNLESVIARTTAEHLMRSVFKTWDYADALDNQSLHLDPSEDRRHAHQWNRPSGDPSRKNSGGMLGANRLALEAIPLFTSLPEGDSLHTLGFTGSRSDDTRWTWPIWKYPVDLNTMRSVLTRAELQQDVPNDSERRHLSQIGIAAAFRSYRILVGKTPNFTPAQRIV